MLNHLREGDVVGFVANPLNLGHAFITIGQVYNGGDDNGFHRIVHFGIVVEVDGVLSLVEFTVTKLFPWPSGGMVITPLADRLAAYPFGAVGFFLNKTARAKLSVERLRQWVKDHFHDKYNVWGLGFAVLQWFIGWQIAGYMFCTEAIRSALSFSNAWNGTRYALAAPKFLESLVALIKGLPMPMPRKVTGRVEPQRWSPRDIAEAGVFEHWEVLE